MIYKSELRGFTLVELMIVMAVMAILTAVAVTSYTSNIRKSRRAEVKSILLEDAQFMERYFTENNRYDQNISGLAASLPVLSSPKTGTAQYTISFSSGFPTSTAYTIQAVPVSSQSMASDECGTFILNNLGQQTNANLVAPKTSDECWTR
ncbi:type IV pilin protein [Undibacterium sp. Rencai35W]|uniref:type IV pilin protein n=1 Tax=Undibacterium sp. Rencai35W TaxID=3413046 RepID=UPI003BF344C5